MKTHGTLRLAGGAYAWMLDASPHVHLRAKRIFGKLKSQHRGKLALSNTPENCRDLEWFLDRYPMVMSDADRQALTLGANSHRDHLASLEQLIDPAYTPPSFALAVPARSYQTREAALYLKAGSLLIGDDVGLGKTAAAICSFMDARTLPAIVVTMTHLPRQWAEEIKKFAPSLRVHILTKGTPYELPKADGRGPDVIITNYHKIVGWSKVLAAYGKSLVFDEIQELRHGNSQRYNAAFALAEEMRFRLGLSATPIYNYGGEIYNILNILKPGCLGTWSEFQTEWCHEARGKEKATLKDAKAFGSWLRDEGLMIRHTRQDVGRELPAVLKIPQPIESDSRALDRVEGAAAELARIILTNAERESGGMGAFEASQQLSVMLRQATGVAKAPYVAAFVRLLVDSGEKVVLCGWHREVYAIWQHCLADLKPVMYTGTETAAQKDAAREAFMRGESPVMILSLRSGAGMNGLQQVSSCIVFGELDWSPGVHEQCIGRLNRDGQKNPVVAYFMIAEDGADPAIVETLGLKREQVEGIRNPTRDFLEHLDLSGSHARRLAERYLQQRGLRLDKSA